MIYIITSKNRQWITATFKCWLTYCRASPVRHHIGLALSTYFWLSHKLLDMWYQQPSCRKQYLVRQRKIWQHPCSHGSWAVRGWCSSTVSDRLICQLAHHRIPELLRQVDRPMAVLLPACYLHSSQKALRYSAFGRGSVYLCVLCVIVSYCIVVVVLWARWGKPDGIEA